MVKLGVVELQALGQLHGQLCFTQALCWPAPWTTLLYSSPLLASSMDNSALLKPFVGQLHGQLCFTQALCWPAPWTTLLYSSPLLASSMDNSALLKPFVATPLPHNTHPSSAITLPVVVNYLVCTNWLAPDSGDVVVSPDPSLFFFAEGAWQCQTL